MKVTAVSILPLQQICSLLVRGETKMDAFDLEIAVVGGCPARCRPFFGARQPAYQVGFSRLD